MRDIIKGLTLSLIIILAVIGAPRLVKSQEESFWTQSSIIRCCSQADAVYADDYEILPDGSVKATITGTGPRNHKWAEAAIGKSYIIPKDKVVTLEGSFKDRPGRPILFISPANFDHVYCFVPGILV